MIGKLKFDQKKSIYNTFRNKNGLNLSNIK